MLTILYNLALYGGLGLTIFFVVVLLRVRPIRLSRVLLAIVFAHFVGLYILLHSPSYTPGQEWMYLLIAFFLFTPGPALRMYVESTYQPSLTFSRLIQPYRWTLLIAGFVVMAVMWLPISNDAQIVLLIGIASVGWIYLWYQVIKTFRLINRYRGILREEYANLSPYDLEWVKLLVYGILCLLVIDLILGLALGAQPTLAPYAKYTLVIYTSFIAYIGFRAITQGEVFLPTRLQVQPDAPLPPPGKATAQRYAVTVLQEWEQRLSNQMKDHEIFRQTDLSLRELAATIDLSDKQLSYLLNQHLDTNFYDYINQHRVLAFQNAIQAEAQNQYTLLAIALSCGFSSKSSFNRIFKQRTGMTPSEFVRSQP